MQPKPQLNLLDFYDDSPLQQALESPPAPADASRQAAGQAPAASAAASAPAARAQAPAAAAAPPKPRSLADDILGDLYAPVSASSGAGPGAGAAAGASEWGAAAVRGPQTNNPFAPADVADTPPVDDFGDSAFGDAGFGEPAFGAPFSISLNEEEADIAAGATDILQWRLLAASTDLFRYTRSRYTAIFQGILPIYISRLVGMLGLKPRLLRCRAPPVLCLFPPLLSSGSTSHAAVGLL